MYKLEGKVALVTGAGGEHGIGRAIATRLAAEGADLVVNDVVENPYAGNASGWRGLPSLVRQIEGLGRQVLSVVADVSVAAQVEVIVQQAVARFGHLDILVANAGSRPGRDRVEVVDLEEEDWDLVQRVNGKGVFLSCRAVARQLIAQGQGGKIITLSSSAGKQGYARFGAYCASKFAVIGLTQCLALELAPHHINVNAICPDTVDTERTAYIAAMLAPDGVKGEEYHREMLRQKAELIPLGRVATIEDIARTAAFLASAESDFLTGLAISVSGGLVMH
ncbi:MAG: SDR family oxidoreductase [Candidatus Latescibacteria bacterium]|nr:SDR family oxidoreductase [Candidatus Latescibacterota bacterium]